VESVWVTGSASEDESIGPTMVYTFSEEGKRPYVDAILDINPIDSNSSLRVVVFVQSMRVIFDAVSRFQQILFVDKRQLENIAKHWDLKREKTKMGNASVKKGLAIYRAECEHEYFLRRFSIDSTVRCDGASRFYHL